VHLPPDKMLGVSAFSSYRICPLFLVLQSVIELLAFTSLLILSETLINHTMTCTKSTCTCANKQQQQSTTVDKSSTHKAVTTYYGETLQETSDLKTNACCTAASPAPHIREAIANIHPSVIAKYYGCGFCVPDEVEGMTILDLGCGAGRDVYIASQLVGEKGRVIGGEF
jgi:hypothetical protein